MKVTLIWGQFIRIVAMQMLLELSVERQGVEAVSILFDFIDKGGKCNN